MALKLLFLRLHSKSCVNHCHIFPSAVRQPEKAQITVSRSVLRSLHQNQTLLVITVSLKRPEVLGPRRSAVALSDVQGERG